MKERNGDPDFLVAGLGASAGGIHALTSFFEQVPAGSGIAYVVILHLSPDHDSQLSQILQVHTSLPVMQVTKKIKVAPDHIYVIPPNQHLLMEEDCIAVSPNMQVEDRRAPVDIFFRTLAETLGPRAVCVVLSGTGANGSMGLKRVKERGGAVFVQNPREAEYNEMPRNAIATELVDDVLPVAAIPGKIIAYRQSLTTVRIPETSREELQSMNEELRTVNQALKVKIEETNLNSNNLENLINSASIGTIFLDRNLRIALFTPAARDIFNLIPGDHGRPLSDITHRLEYKTLIQDVETVMEKLTVMEREINSQQGFTYLMRILPYRTAEGPINGVVITFFDITTRKKAEDDLLAAKNELYGDLHAMIRLQELSVRLTGITDIRLLLEDILDATMEFQGAQMGAIQLYQHDLDRLTIAAQRGLGKAFLDYLNETVDDGTPSWRALKTSERMVIADVEKSAVPSAYRSAAAVAGFRTVQATPVFDRAGNPLGVLSTYFHKPHRLSVRELRLTDLHAGQAAELVALKLSEKALAESEERYRVAMSSAGMGFWDWNIPEDSVVWNENVYLLLGLPPDSKAKSLQFFLELVHPDDVGTVKQAIQTAIQKMGVYRTEFRITRPDNKQVVWMSAYGRLLEYEEGNAKRMIGVIYDITHHKKLEQQKDEFLTIASHELKTPVTGIKAYTELLLRLFRQAGQEEPIALMEKLDGQVDRLTELIKSLLDATRIAEGQLPLHKERIDLNAMITNCVQDLQRLSPQHTLVFIPGEIGPVVADRERICQVITNLISNAVRYSPGAKEVTIATVAFENGVKVSVQDKGIGIPAELLDKVFDRFFRIGREQVNTFPGMGLGLYISAGIVHRHGGRIVAESTPGEGSLFYFTLPYAGKDE